MQVSGPQNGELSDMIATLLVRLRNGEAAEREEAAEALVEVGGRAVPALGELLQDESESVRERAVQVLGAIGGERAGEALVPALTDPEPPVRECAARCVGAIGVQPAVQSLVALVTDGDRNVRETAVRALGRFEDRDGSIADAVVTALADPNPYVREAAAKTLGAVGDVAAVAALTAAASDSDPYVRESVARALGRLGGDGAVTCLVALLDDEDSYVRADAAEALGAVGEGFERSLLETALTDPSERVRERVQLALDQLTAAAADAAQSPAVMPQGDAESPVEPDTAAVPSGRGIDSSEHGVGTVESGAQESTDVAETESAREPTPEPDPSRKRAHREPPQHLGGGWYLWNGAKMRRSKLPKTAVRLLERQRATGGSSS